MRPSAINCFPTSDSRALSANCLRAVLHVVPYSRARAPTRNRALSRAGRRQSVPRRAAPPPRYLTQLFVYFMDVSTLQHSRRRTTLSKLYDFDDQETSLQQLNYTELSERMVSTLDLPRTLALSIEVVFSNPPEVFRRSPRTSKRKLTSHHALASLAHLVSTEKVWPVLQVNIPWEYSARAEGFSRGFPPNFSLSLSARLLRHLLLGPNQIQIDSP